MDKTLSPPTKPPRVSVPLTDEVLQVFQRLAKAGNMSTGRAIAEWLADTVEAAEYMTATMERARAAPKVVMREMHAYALGLADETGELMRTLAEKGKVERAKAAVPHVRKRSANLRNSGLGDVSPPPCNTGGKLPQPPQQQQDRLKDFSASLKVKAAAKKGPKVPKKGAQ